MPVIDRRMMIKSAGDKPPKNHFPRATFRAPLCECLAILESTRKNVPGPRHSSGWLSFPKTHAFMQLLCEQLSTTSRCTVCATAFCEQDKTQGLIFGPASVH